MHVVASSRRVSVARRAASLPNAARLVSCDPLFHRPACDEAAAPFAGARDARAGFPESRPPPMTTPTTQKDPWQEMLKRFNEAARRLNLDEGVWKILSEADLELKVSIPVVMDNGKVEVFTGYRVQHSRAMGP